MAVNVAPVITGQGTVTLLEDSTRTLLVTDLLVTDPDNAFPADFALEASPGDHYVLEGLLLRPDANFAGELHVPVRVTDGRDFSNAFLLRVDVTPVNDAPVITSQTALSAASGSTLEVALGDVVIADVDSVYPGAFRLLALPGNNYTVTDTAKGFTLGIDAAFSGTLDVPVSANDGTDTGPVFGFQVNVIMGGVVPAITGQDPISTDEDTPFTITLADLVVTDAAEPGSTVKVLAGANYAVEGNVITPAQDFAGELQVTVRVNNGTLDSAPYVVTVTVSPVNDAPVVVAQGMLTTDEDTPLSITLDDLDVVDVDDTVGDLVLTLQPGPQHTLDGLGRVVPAQDFNGTLEVTATVGDGDAVSDAYVLSVVVLPVNDAPVITGQQGMGAVIGTAREVSLMELQVTDVDNTYPLGFSVLIQDGTGYTHTGTSFTLEGGVSGTVTVNVRVSDGMAESATFPLTVSVLAAPNVAPVITGPAALTTAEDAPLLLDLANINVTDPDAAPGTLALVVSPGPNHAVMGTTVVPAQDFSGSLQVTLVASDGFSSSAPFTVTITVTPVDDAPVITATGPRTTAEDTALTLSLADVTATDVDNAQAELVFSVQDGAGYTHAGNVVTPAQDFNGDLQVNVVVSSGASSSAPATVTVTVTPVNDAPVITADMAPATLNEDGTLDLALGLFSVTDPDGPSATLVVEGGSNHAVTGTTVVPAADFNGMLMVNVRVFDGVENGPAYALAITVNSVNDAPVITMQMPISSSEGAAVPLDLSLFTVTDVDHPGYPAGFTLTVGSGSNYAVTGTTVQPDAEFSGTLTVPVTVADPDGLSSATFNASITVTAVNDAPVITAQATLSTAEDTAITLTATNFTVTDVDHPGYPSGFTVTLGTGSNYSVSGLTVTPAPDFNGTLSVPVTVTDPAGLASAVFSATISVTAANDPPVITMQATLSTAEDTSLVLALANFTATDVDHPGYPAGFTLTVGTGSNYAVAGTTVTPALDFNGTLTVPVTVRDAGGATSAVFNAMVTVTAVNDAPVITGQNPNPLTVAEDTPLSILLTQLVVTDVDHAGYPSGFSLQVEPGSNYAVAGTAVTPVSNFNGLLLVGVRVTDPAGAQSASFTLRINVTAVNDPPVITASSATSAINEDTSFTVLLSHLSVADPDNAYPTGFTLALSSCVNCTISGATITPTLNFFSGAAMTVNVVVNDGAANSNTFPLSFNVVAVNDPPVGVADTANTTGNTHKDIAAPGVLANDTDVDDMTLTTVAGTITSTQMGTVTMAADGSYRYLPRAGFTGMDTFTYTVRDAAGATGTGTVTVTVTNRVWYVDDDAPVGGDGRSLTPFRQLSSAASPSQAGDTIYVFAGNQNGIVLKAQQRLIGAGTTLVRSPFNADIPAGVRPTLGTSASVTVALAADNTLSGFNVSNGTGTAIGGSNVGTLTVEDVNITNVSNGVVVSGGTMVNLRRMNLTTLPVSGLGSGRGLAMSRTAMTVDTVVVDGAALTALEVTDATGSSTFTGFALRNCGQDGIFWENTGAVGAATATFTNLVINGTQDPGSAVILRSDGSVTSGANANFTFTSPTFTNIRGFGDGFNMATEGTRASLNVTISDGVLDNTVGGVGAGGNAVRTYAASNLGVLTLTMTNNNIRRWNDDAVSMEAASFGSLVGTITGNVIGDTNNSGVEGSVNGDGFALRVDGPLTGAATTQAVVNFTGNRVRNVLGRGFHVESRGPSVAARAKATFANNAVDAMNRSAPRPSLNVRSRDASLMCASFQNDNMVVPAGGVTGSLITQANTSVFHRTTQPLGTVSLVGTFNSGACPF